MKSIIEEECSAYIQNKAKEQGMECQVSVNCGGEEKEYPYPVTVSIIGVLNNNQREWLETLIETDLGVPRQEQTYRTESGEKD